MPSCATNERRRTPLRRAALRAQTPLALPLSEENRGFLGSLAEIGYLLLTEIGSHSAIYL
jgi:hypothetical protein